jgi:hypothetical protein
MRLRELPRELVRDRFLFGLKIRRLPRDDRLDALV